METVVVALLSLERMAVWIQGFVLIYCFKCIWLLLLSYNFFCHC